MANFMSLKGTILPQFSIGRSNLLILDSSSLTSTRTVLWPDYNLTWPSTSGSSGQLLTTNGSGGLSWTSLASFGVSSITGTANQITASASTGAVTLSLPASVTLSTGLTISSFAANAHVYTTTAGLLGATAAATNGQLLIGRTGNIPLAATLTQGTGITVTNGAGTITIANTGVTSVGLTMPGIFTVTNSPVTTTGTLTVTATGTSGGIPYFSSSTTLASTAVLAANQIVIGGGAGASPATLGSLGTTTTVLHGNAAGAPSFGAVVNADLNVMPANTIKGNNTGSSATPVDLTVSQAQTLLNIPVDNTTLLWMNI